MKNESFQFLDEDFSVKEMRKTYDLPENASFEHMTSFLTAKGLKFVQVFVRFNEIFLFRYVGRRISIGHTTKRTWWVKTTKSYSWKFYPRFVSDDHHHEVQKYAELIKDFNFDEFFKSAFEPKISDDADKGGKKIDLALDMTGFRPDQIQIHLKDHDLIVQVKRRKRKRKIKSIRFSSRPNQVHRTNNTQLVRSSTKRLLYHPYVTFSFSFLRVFQSSKRICFRTSMSNICVRFFTMENVWLSPLLIKQLLLWQATVNRELWNTVLIAMWQWKTEAKVQKAKCLNVLRQPVRLVRSLVPSIK